MGGTDDPSNIVYLTVKQHAEAHRILYKKYGNWQDRIAWQGLAGIIGKEEIIRQVQSEAGKKGGKAIKAIWDSGELKPVYEKGSKKAKEEGTRLSKLASKDRENNPEKYKKLAKEASKTGTMDNSMHGKCWCLPTDFTDVNKHKKVFCKDSIPKGWLPIKDARDARKSRKGVYGYRWIKNTRLKRNRYIKANCELPKGWVYGRDLSYGKFFSKTEN